MRRYLSLIPCLVHAIICVGIILIATPLLALLHDRRRSHRGHNMTDDYDLIPNPENTPTERSLLEVTDALDVAGAPHTDTERDGVGINLELDLHARVRWLMNDRDGKAKDVTLWRGRCKDARDQLARIESMLRDAGAPLVTTDQGVVWLVRELKTKYAELTGLGELCGKAQHDRDFFRKQAEEVGATVAGFMQQRDDLMRQRDDMTTERADAEARADALEAELAMLEAHVDDLDAELGKRLDPDDAMDCWLGWDQP